MTDRDLPVVLSRAPNALDKYGVDLWTGTTEEARGHTAHLPL